MRDFSKNLDVEAWRLSKSGIYIWYMYEGKEQVIVGNSEQGVELLKKNDLINNYCIIGHDVYVEWETLYDSVDHSGEHIQAHDLHIAPWEDFIEHFLLTEIDAMCIAALEEAGKAANRSARVFDKVLAGIKRMGQSL